MTQARLSQVRDWFQRTESLLGKAFYASYPLNEFWKKYNTPQMLQILHNAENEQQALELIQGTYFFVVKLAGKAAEMTLEWQWKRLESEAPELLKDIERVGESPLVPQSITLPHRGTRYSVDIVRVATVARTVLDRCVPTGKQQPVFFELGAGLGHLCRFVLSLAPKAKYIISDLPISLCFSYLFISNNFPDKRVLLMEADATLTKELLEEYDIILAPPSVMQNTQPVEVDAFINTCSLGEMDNRVSSQWFNYITNLLKPSYVYSLNRFLNHIDESADFQWRKQENAHLSGVGASWTAEHFLIEEERFFGPYLACIHPRYLELILKRLPEGQDEALPDVTELSHSIEAHASISLYANHNWSVNYHGARLTNDLSKQGELYACWNAARIKPCVQTYLLLLLYLDRMNCHSRMPFEETKFIEEKLMQMVDQLAGKQKASLKSYLEHRAKTIMSLEPMHVVERNNPGDVAALLVSLRVDGEQGKTAEKGILHSLTRRIFGK